MIFALLVASSLCGVSTAFGSRKALAPTPGPAPGAIGMPPLPIDLGFTPLSSKDPKVIELATFAVDEYNKANNNKLVFSFVLEAIFTTNEEETNYELAIGATNDKDLHSYFVNISVAKDVKKLTSFAQAQWVFTTLNLKSVKKYVRQIL